MAFSSVSAERCSCEKLSCPGDTSRQKSVRARGGITRVPSTLMDFQHLLAAKAVDFIQPSPAKMGGITELKKVFAMADANKVEVAVHSFYEARGCSRTCM